MQLISFAEEYRAGYVVDTEVVGNERVSINTVGYYKDQDQETSKDPPLSVYRRRGRTDYVLCYVEAGTVKAELYDTMYEISNGAFLYKPHQKQRYYSIENKGPFSIYWIHFSGSAVNGMLNECKIHDRFKFNTGAAREIVSVFEQIIHEMRMKQFTYESYSTSLLQYLLSIISRTAYINENHPEEQFYVRIQDALEFIHTNYQEDLNVTELAERANLSTSRFSSLFNEHLDCFPKTYITQYRINKACELLKNTDMAINQIAYFTGFRDPLYFSRIFKKYVSVPPSEYRINQDMFTVLSIDKEEDVKNT